MGGLRLSRRDRDDSDQAPESNADMPVADSAHWHDYRDTVRTITPPDRRAGDNSEPRRIPGPRAGPV